MRRKLKKRAEITPDHLYNSVKVEKFINYVMSDGKKNTARKVVYDAFRLIKEKEKTETPLEDRSDVFHFRCAGFLKVQRARKAWRCISVSPTSSSRLRRTKEKR